MTNRAVMQQALEALDIVKLQYTQNRHINDAITAIKAALEQPVQEPSQWRDIVVVALVREGVNKHRARELADHFAAQRPWIGLTNDDRFEIAAEQHGWEDLLIAAEAKLKNKNT